MSDQPRNSKDAQNVSSTTGEGPAGARFRLIEEVHHGLMGSVWRAIDDITLAPVAVKLVPVELAPALDAEELAALTRVSSHAGLVTLIEHGRHGSWWQQAADWVHGETLESLLGTDRGKAQVAANLGRWMTQLAAALDAHHRTGFVHGDVKASNVLVTHDQVCLIQLVGLRIGASWDTHGGLTPSCASPEARAGAPADPRDDVYGLAQMANFLLAATSALKGSAETTPSGPAGPYVASPEPPADRGTGGADTVEGVRLASLTTPDALAVPALPDLPVVPGVPAVPDVPTIPRLPVLPDVPVVPDVPIVPALGGLLGG